MELSNLDQIPKVSLVLAPTPLHKLNHLSEELGLDLWIKRDDLTGFAFGGNKGRKLEYLIGQALAEGAQVITTCGSAQSNFVRQLAAACSMYGIKFAAIVMQLPYEYEPASGGMNPHGGNVLLDQILGGDVRVVPNGTWDELYALTDALTVEYIDKGLRVFQIPIGGSSPQGAFAFYQAGLELQDQASACGGPFDFVISASSSGSTQTGLTYAFQESSTRVIGISCDPEPEMVHDFARLSEQLDALTGLGRPLSASDFAFDLRFVGDGYGVPSNEGLAVIADVARKEGVFLDPIYTSKAFLGLVSMARSGEISGRVCFWHTGGTPALFAIPEGVSGW